MVTFEDLAVLSASRVSKLDHWIEQHADRTISRLRWWHFLFGELEDQIDPILADVESANVAELLDPLPLLIEAAIGRGEIEPVDGALWVLRFALRLARVGAPVAVLPDVLVPDRAASYAMAHVPFDRKGALVENRRQLALNALELAGGPVGEVGSDRQGILLGELFTLLHHLVEIEPYLADPVVRRETRAWAVTYRLLLVADGTRARLRP